MHTDVPEASALNAPARQAVHTLEVVAAATPLYAPAAHAEHAAAEAAGLYAPAVHAVHTTEVVAAGADEYAPAVHEEQAPVDHPGA